MIPEIREALEHEERTTEDGGVYNVEQKLQSYLRDKFSVESLNDAIKREKAERLLTQVAKDWCIKHTQERSDIEYAQLAKDAVSKYLSNWYGKIQGEDDRGHRFGETW